MLTKVKLRSIYNIVEASNGKEALYVIDKMHIDLIIVIIDEWDCIFREDKDNTKLQDEYVNLLRVIFKDGFAEAFIKLAYITGILPIKKYGTQSALNNFREYILRLLSTITSSR